MKTSNRKNSANYGFQYTSNLGSRPCQEDHSANGSDLAIVEAFMAQVIRECGEPPYDNQLKIKKMVSGRCMLTISWDNDDEEMATYADRVENENPCEYWDAKSSRDLKKNGIFVSSARSASAYPVNPS